jgi:hypothetical protein
MTNGSHECPLADRAVGLGGRFARQGDDRADLLGANVYVRARTRCIRQPLRHAQLVQRPLLQPRPAVPPEPDRLPREVQMPADLDIRPARRRVQDDARPQRRLLGGALGMGPLFQGLAGLLGQADWCGSWTAYAFASCPERSTRRPPPLSRAPEIVFAV